MIIAFTGAGISKASGIPTFQEQEGIRNKLDRNFANMYKEEYEKVIKNMQEICNKAKPNDAHYALAEYNIPIITMNVDGLHQKAGSKNVLNIHGEFPNIVLYGDPAPKYKDALYIVDKIIPDDIFLIIGVSFYTSISLTLRQVARDLGAEIFIINNNAEENVRAFLKNHKNYIGEETFEQYMARENYGYF